MHKEGAQYYGALAITVMMLLGSGPWMDQRQSVNKVDFGEYSKRVKSSVIPFFRFRL